MDRKSATLLGLWTLLIADVCLSQRDCTGVDCPTLEHCIETVLESGACCPTCVQRGCTCEGYQYYDCIQAGFQKGKVPQGRSYMVDFGSTECSCPQGGGKISCHFMPCPDLPPNCLEVLHLADGCPECGRLGCADGGKEYEAGHSFQTEQCQVCHCPDRGGRLMCSPIPGCDLRGRSKPARVGTAENKKPLRAAEARAESRPAAPRELAPGNTLPLYKPDPPSSGTEHYDRTSAGPTASALQDVARPLESTTLPPPAHPESSSVSLGSSDDGRPEQSHAQEGPGPEGGPGEGEVTASPTASDPPAEAATPLASTQSATTENHRPPPQESSQRATRQHSESRRGSTESAGRQKPSPGPRRRSQASSRSVGPEEQEKTSTSQSPYPKVQFGPTSRGPVRMSEDGDQPKRQAQTLFNDQNQGAEGEAEGRRALST